MMNDKQIIIRRYTIYIRTKNILTFSGFIKSSTCPTISHIYVIKHNFIYTLSTRYLHIIYTIFNQYLECIYSPSRPGRQFCRRRTAAWPRCRSCWESSSAWWRPAPGRSAPRRSTAAWPPRYQGSSAAAANIFIFTLDIFQLKNILLFVLTDCVPCNLFTKSIKDLAIYLRCLII